MVLICLPKDSVPKVNDWWNRIFIDKWIHAGMFGLLSLLCILPIKDNKSFPIKKRKALILFISLTVSIWGLVTECIQLYIPGRSFDLLDWGADSLGVLIVWIYTTLILKNQAKGLPVG